MSWWTDIRDSIESIGSVVGNYLLPGSGFITGQMTSKGSQEQLGSPLGRLAMLGSGFTGAGVGSSMTGIPAASDVGAGWGNAWNAISGGGAPADVVGSDWSGGAGTDAGAPSWTSGSDLPTTSPARSYMDQPLGGFPGSAGSGGSPWWSSPNNALRSMGMISGGTGGGGAGNGSSGATGMGTWLSPLMSVGSGLYGLSQAEQQKKLAMQALQGSSPWASSGGMAGAGSALTNAIQGDFANDPGFALAQRAAAATSSTQPGGFAAQAAANAALQYQNQRIQALSGPAGTQFSPAQGYATAGQINQGANSLASSSLGSIGYGVGTMTGQNQMPPWLQNWFIQNNMRSTTPVQE